MSIKNDRAEILIHYPSCYRDFFCAGSTCEFTCCAGWNISADEKAIGDYAAVKGDFGRRLRNSIEKDGSFAQRNGRCLLLNQENLCEIYINLGKENMCKTCRTYPRHAEVYGFLHEVSLSLSCPAAAKLILETKEADVFLSKLKPNGRKMGRCELDSGERKLLKRLQRVRESMFSIMGKRGLPIRLRMAMVLSLGHDTQRRLNHTQPVLPLLKRYIETGAADRFAKRLEGFLVSSQSKGTKKRQDLMCAYLERCGALHPVVGDWKKRMEHTARLIYGTAAAEERYEGWQRKVEFENAFYPVYMEHLMNYFLYVYVLGAVYDGDLYSKVKIAVFSCLIIREMNIGSCAEKGGFTETAAVQNAYLYARELEHSDENIEILEAQMSGRYAPGLTELLLCL